MNEQKVDEFGSPIRAEPVLKSEGVSPVVVEEIHVGTLEVVQELDNNFSTLTKTAEDFVSDSLNDSLPEAIDTLKNDIKSTALEAANVSHEKTKIDIDTNKVDNERKRLENENKRLDNATFNLKLRLKKKAMRREEKLLKQEQNMEHWKRHKKINDEKFDRLRKAGITTNNIVLLRIISFFYLLDDIKKGTNKLLKTVLTLVFWGVIIALVVIVLNTPAVKSLLRVIIN